MNKVLLVLLIAILAIISCEKQESPNMETLRKLYKYYKYGEIDQCKLGDKIVFCAGQSHYDASSYIYDNSGIQIGACHWAWGPVDPICNQLTSCEVIYRCENHINGEPPVDKYSLGD